MALFRKKAKKVEEPVVDQVSTQIDEGTIDNDSVKTNLVFHSEWFMTPQEKYIYQYHHQQLPELKPNQISIYGLKLQEYGDELFVIAFLRNTLKKSIKFEAVDLLILDENDQPIAKQKFEMDDLVELPPMSCMPWRFLFSEESKLTEELPAADKWKIAFELKKKATPENHKLDLDESWAGRITDSQKEQLEQLVSRLPKLSAGEVNFMGIETKFMDEGGLAVTVLIRNGSEKNINLEQIPLVVEDADKDVVCKGGFKLDKLEIKANTSKPWTFIFPAQLVLKPDANLQSWRVYPPTPENQAV